MAKRGRKPLYTGKSLRKKINEYWDSISYEKAVTDAAGYPIINKAGNEIKLTDYAEPPDVTALCLYLGIDRSTWNNYCDPALHPEMQEITTETKMRMEAYLWRELNTREKGVQGIKFNLENNYGYRDRKEVDLGKETVKTMGDISTLSIAERVALITSAANQLNESEHEDGDED